MKWKKLNESVNDAADALEENDGVEIPSVEEVIEAMADYGMYDGIPEGPAEPLQWLWGSQCAMAAVYLMDKYGINSVGSHTKEKLLSAVKEAMAEFMQTDDYKRRKMRRSK